MEIIRCEDIVRHGHSLRPNMTREEYFDIRFVAIDDILDDLNNAIDKGNVLHGFSAALWISNLKKKLENTAHEKSKDC